jgi:hypothetical protein
MAIVFGLVAIGFGVLCFAASSGGEDDRRVILPCAALALSFLAASVTLGLH